MEILEITVQAKRKSKDQDASRVPKIAWAAVATLALTILILAIAVVGNDAAHYALMFLQAMK